MQVPFIKMNGAGNDFVIIDGRNEIIRLTPQVVRALASRDNGGTGGCDQVIVLEGSKNADLFMRIYNADGGEVNACGNATRCVAALLEDELSRLPVSIETKAGLLKGLEKAHTPEGVAYILVDMGAPRTLWQEIPLTMPYEQAIPKVEAMAGLKEPAFISMGNPHVVFFLRFDPADASGTIAPEPLFNVNIERMGPALEKFKEVFPEGVNVSIALLRQAKDGLGHIVHARVWERGAGLTQACGTAACAILAAAHARDSSVESIHLWFEPAGHAVTVKRTEEGHILLGGPIEKEFSGNIAL